MISFYKLNKISIIMISLLVTFVFTEDLTQEQLNQIEEATEDIFKAPNFSLKSTSDSLYVLEEMKGQVVLLNFWATWCGPCRLEIPDFNDLYEYYHEKGLEILGISISDSKEQLLQFLQSYNVKYPLLYGNSIEMEKVITDYGAGYSVPVSFLVNTKGELIRGYPGAILRQYNPGMYADLIYNIESSLNTKINDPAK